MELVDNIKSIVAQEAEDLEVYLEDIKKYNNQIGKKYFKNNSIC